MIETSTVRSFREFFSAWRSINPSLFTPRQTTSTPSVVSVRAVSKTEGCSIAETIILGLSIPLLPAATPLTTKLLASVAEAVKTTSLNFTFNSSAIISREWSKAACAFCPQE